ncbi:MAG: tRNA (adenosine(37)-N6)-threonylcarbamoyltransferase complex ATPase subunit type 1 TsaE [Puniceicoccales bacterium]|jgi:tRNA threonylcarbamoyladenosine biosynthesis protein TsaE|nr:tRNA (adenosine(37)-N6)-threonylcarbamoyltransferase complex ATPase subunit type 1 TsaE [Puniceicoccales bacterium]
MPSASKAGPHLLRDEALEAALLEGILCLSPDETHRLAGRFADALPENSTLFLHGDLGAGKTTFVQGMAESYGISAAVTSPTFTLWNCYEGRYHLFHVDAYRLESAPEAEALYLEDFLQVPYVLCVEWPEKIADGHLVPDAHLWFSQPKGKPDARIIRLSREHSALG